MDFILWNLVLIISNGCKIDISKVGIVDALRTFTKSKSGLLSII